MAKVPLIVDGREYPIEGDPSYVDWFGPGGDFFAACDMCEYVGRMADSHARALASARQHAVGQRHRRRLRLRQLRRG